jgi:hypothetical protein
MDLDGFDFETLWAVAGLTGVLWTLLSLRARTLLEQTVAGLLGDAGVLQSCDLRRAKFKPGRKLTAYYDTTVRDAASQQSIVRSIEVTWRPPTIDTQPEPMPELASLQDEARMHGLAAPFTRLVTEIPKWGMHVQVAPLDSRFPQLVRVSDPAYVRAMLASAGLTPAIDPAPEYTVSAIRYRPGQRHVLRYDRIGDPSGTLFAKVYNSDKGARIFDVVARVADWLEAHGDGLRTVRPCGYIAGDGVVLYPLVPGTPLSQLLRAPGQETDRLLRETGGALAALHRTPLDIIELQPHSFAKEIKGIVSASEHVHPLLPAAGAAITAILDRARALHERLPQEPPGFAYGDFKADHLWVTPDGLTLIDFDTCYLFDPAIDLGKFLADLQWWYDGYGQPGVAEAQAQFLLGYGPDAPAERLLRARLYEVLVLVKTTVRRVRLFDSDWAERTTRLVAHADTLLTELESMLR